MRWQQQSQRYTTFTLPSGRQVKILSIAPIHFQGGAPPALMLSYETDVKLSTRTLHVSPQCARVLFCLVDPCGP
jgi:hypothetical protein